MSFSFSSTLAGLPGLPSTPGCFGPGFSADSFCFCDWKLFNSRLGCAEVPQPGVDLINMAAPAWWWRCDPWPSWSSAHPNSKASAISSLGSSTRGGLYNGESRSAYLILTFISATCQFRNDKYQECTQNMMYIWQYYDTNVLNILKRHMSCIYYVYHVWKRYRRNPLSLNRVYTCLTTQVVLRHGYAWYIPNIWHL